MPIQFHALMQDSNDRDHFASDLIVDRMPANQCLEISLADQCGSAHLLPRRDGCKRVDDPVGMTLGLRDGPFSRRVNPNSFEISFRHWRKHMFAGDRSGAVLLTHAFLKRLAVKGTRFPRVLSQPPKSSFAAKLELRPSG